MKVGDRVWHKLVRHRGWNNEMLIVRIDPNETYPVFCRRYISENFRLEQFTEEELVLVPEER